MSDLASSAKDRMDKAISALENEFKSIRTGRASIGMFDKLRVEYFDQQLPLNQVATISIPEARLVVIQPWDPEVLGTIERAVQQSELSLNPNNDGKVIRISIPPLTEERRKEIAKIARNTAESARVSVRNVRREVNEEIKKQQKSGDLSEDAAKRLMGDVQKLTDSHVEKINTLVEAKEAEIMEV